MAATQLQDLVWIYALFTLHLAMPGPGMLFICTSAARGQRRRALAFVAGTSIGTAAWAGFAVLGAWRLTSDAPLLLGGLKLLVGLVLVVLGARIVVVAFAASGLAAASDGGSPLGAFLHGILLTMASANEVVFWTAILALGAGAVASGGPEPAFAVALVLGVVVIAFAVEATLACIATSGGVARRVTRLRRPLEVALGLAYGVTGGALLQLV